MKRDLEREDKIVYCSMIESTGQAYLQMGLGFQVEEGMSSTLYYSVQRRNKYETESG